MRAKTIYEGLFSKKLSSDNRNVEILNKIYNEFDLKYHEGKFNPKTWKRRGNLLPSENRNDEIITEFAGISISFDIKTEIYKISIPVKFKDEFKNNIEKLLLNMDFDIIDSGGSKYTKIIKFK